MAYANFDLYNIGEGAQSLLKVLRLYKEEKVDAAEKEGAWMKDKSIDVYVIRLISSTGDSELSKLVGHLGAFTGKKFHVRLKQQLLLSRKFISLQEFQTRYSSGTLRGFLLANLVDKVGVEKYFELLREILDAGIEIRGINGVLKAKNVINMDMEQVRIFIRRHLELKIEFSAILEEKEEGKLDLIYPKFGMHELEVADWHKKIYWDPMAISGRETCELINTYLDSPNRLNRSMVYDYFVSLDRAEFLISFSLVSERLVLADPKGELIMDILDIYVQDFERISFTQGLALCLSICDNYDQKSLMDYVSDLSELVEEDKKIYENYSLTSVNRYTVPAIFRRFKFTNPVQIKFAYQVLEKLAYSPNVPHLFMQYVGVYVPELIDDELVGISVQAAQNSVSEANISILQGIAESEPAANWRLKVESLIANGAVLSSREWSTGVDSAIRAKNRDLFDFAIKGFVMAPDLTVEYFLFHSARFLMVWGEPVEWDQVIKDFHQMRKERNVDNKEYLPAWMFVWMVRNSADRWIKTVENFIEEYMYLLDAIDSRVLSALCERYRVVKQTEDIRRVIGRFGSRVNGEGDWALLVLARAYYEVSLPDMAILQLEEIASGVVSQEVSRRAHSYGVRFSDHRVFEMFDQRR